QVAAVLIEDLVHEGLVGGVLLDQGPAGLRAEGDVAPLVTQNQPKSLLEPGERVPEVGGVDHDLVGGHREHALDETVVGGREAHEGGLDRLLLAVQRGLQQLSPEARKRLVKHVADLEAPARIDRRPSDQEMARHLLGLEHADDLVVPAHEELGVLGLLHQEGREKRDPVEAPERVGGRDHRHQLVRDGLLASEEARGHAEQALALLIGDPLPVGGILGEVEVVDIPDLLDRELVLAVHRALDHRAREVEAADDVGVEWRAVAVGHQFCSSLPSSTSVDMSMITSSSSKLPCSLAMCRWTASTSASSSGATMIAPQPASRHSY